MVYVVYEVVVCDGGGTLISETGEIVRSDRDEDVSVGMWMNEERSAEDRRKGCEIPWEWRALRQDAEDHDWDGSTRREKRERLCEQDSSKHGTCRGGGEEEDQRGDEVIT